jgi:hypothetical protein
METDSNPMAAATCAHQRRARQRRLRNGGRLLRNPVPLPVVDGGNRYLGADHPNHFVEKLVESVEATHGEALPWANG